MAKKGFVIPVLMYHHVNTEGNFINVKPKIFENHIRYLKEHGFSTFHTDEFLSILNGVKTPPKKSVMITFDDGWLDNWIYAFPILKKYHMKAVIFVITSLISEREKRKRSDEGSVAELPSHKESQKMIDGGLVSDVMLSWDEIREMESSGLIDIQSHTHTHRRWDKLNNNREELKDMLNYELKTSKQIIEEKLGKQCNALCWPWGIYDKNYIELARSLGYELIFTTEKGANTTETEPWRIRRLVIGNISSFNLRKKLFVHSRNWLSKAYLKYLK